MVEGLYLIVVEKRPGRKTGKRNQSVRGDYIWACPRVGCGVRAVNNWQFSCARIRNPAEKYCRASVAPRASSRCIDLKLIVIHGRRPIRAFVTYADEKRCGIALRYGQQIGMGL